MSTTTPLPHVPATEPPGSEGRHPAFSHRVGGAVRDAPSWSGAAVVLAAMVVLLIATQPLFLTWTNISNVLDGQAVPCLLAVGTTFLLLTGVIDLSIGALLAICGMAAAGMLSLDIPGPVVVLGTVILGALLGGLVNGTLVAYAGLSFFVVTLGTLSVFRAVAQLTSDGESLSITQYEGFDAFAWLGSATVGELPVTVLVAAAVSFAAAMLLRYATFGRAILAIGGNANAARLAGIKTTRGRIAVFAINGALVGLAAVLFTGRAASSSPDAATGVELAVLAAVLLGGTSFTGGAGSIVGTVIGVLFIGVLQNGLNLAGVAVFWQGVVTGTVLIVAVGIDRLRAVRR